MKKLSYEKFFKNFSNPTRIAIISCLKDKAMSVGEIVECIGEEQSKVSHNLRNLIRCKLLKSKRDGKRMIYSLNKKTVGPMMHLVEAHVASNCQTCDMDCAKCMGY